MKLTILHFKNLVNCFEGAFTNSSEGVKGRRRGMGRWDEEGGKEVE